jgi:hypothetical protein
MPNSEKILTIRCPKCGKDNVFDQPYPYHAGFSDVGFLYSDSGHCTLVWNWFDPAIKKFSKPGSRLSEDPQARERFERSLRPAPDGGRWRFENPARCLHCSEPIAGPIFKQIYFLVYPDSILTNHDEHVGLSAQIMQDAE